MPHALDTELRDWLQAQAASYLDLSPADLDPDTPLAAYGLDSVYALTIAADIEEHLEIVLEPELMWEHPTLNALTEALLREKAAQHP